MNTVRGVGIDLLMVLPGFFLARCGTCRSLKVTAVGNDGKQRAAAKCDHCGEIGIVRIWPDGNLQPLGQSTFCDCESPELQVIETDPGELP